MAAQSARYVHIVRAPGIAVREKQRPTLAARSNRANRCTTILCSGTHPGNDCTDGAIPPYAKLNMARLAAATANNPRAGSTRIFSPLILKVPRRDQDIGDTVGQHRIAL